MSKRFYQRNYIEVVKNLLPEYYQDVDIAEERESLDLMSLILLGDIELIQSYSKLFPVYNLDPVSSILGWDGKYLTNLPSYFVKNNKVSYVTQESFSLEILGPLGYDIRDYKSREEFTDFLKNILLRKIRIGRGSSLVPIDVATNFLFGETLNATLVYLINSIGLFQIFNYDQDSGNKPLCDYVAEELSKLWTGEPVSEADALVALKRYVWDNQQGLGSTFVNMFGGGLWLSGQDESTSGTQQIEKLSTLTRVLHSSRYGQVDDPYVRDAIETYFSMADINTATPVFTISWTATGGATFETASNIDNDVISVITSKSLEGNLLKFMRAMSFFVSDIDDQVLSLETLHSIEDCPPELLPYLADSVGWTLYTDNSDSHRRQLREALRLYQMKGTAEGLKQLLRVILPGLSLDFDAKYSEYFESYVPNCLYYLLRTESNIKDFDTWTFEDALAYTRGEFSYSSIDLNVRYAVDAILLEAVQTFPELFRLKGLKFSDYNPGYFRFGYRGRVLPIPPFEDERFYKDCDINHDIAEFLEDKLICFGVSEEYASSFKDYVLDNTVRGAREAKYYNNAWLILTSGLELPPNYQSVFENYERDAIDYMPLWSGKSSHMNLAVSSGNFTDEFFQFGAFSKYEFFDALRGVKDFIPAKVIERIHVDLQGDDFIVASVKLCPRVVYDLKDIMSWGALASYQLSSLNMRDSSLGLVTDGKVAFGRDRVTWGLENNILDASGPVAAIGGGRNSKRRRNFENVIHRGEMFNRTGHNQPMFKNVSTSGDGYDYAILGLNPSTMEYSPVTSHTYLPDIWDKCEGYNSFNEYFGVSSNQTFPTRGLEKITASSCHLYTFRDDFSESKELIYSLIRKRVESNAELEFELNKFLFQVPWRNEVQNLKNEFWDSYDLEQDEIYNYKFDKFKINRGVFGGMAYLYENVYLPIGSEGISNSTLEEMKVGGLSVLSHAFGPVYYNALLNVDGTNANKTQSLFEETVLTTASASVGGYTMQDLSALTVDGDEKRDPTVISGVEITDGVKQAGNKISIYELSATETLLDPASPMLNNTVVTMKSFKGMPRLRYTFNYGDENLLFKEHEYSFELSSIFLKEGSYRKTLGSSFVWVHTEPEKDYHGNWVFWNLMPDGEWKHMKAEVFTHDYVRKNLAHKFVHDDLSEIPTPTPCHIVNLPKQALLGLRDSDFQVNKIRISTKNQPIAVPLHYYQKYQQVHRDNQKYVVEVFPSLQLDQEVYWATNGIKMRDETIHHMTSLEFDLSCNDFRSLTKGAQNAVEFLYPDGSLVPLSSTITIKDNQAFSDNKLLTLKLGVAANGQLILKPFLFKTLNAVLKEKLNTEGYLEPNRPFVGDCYQVSNERFGFNFENLYVEGKDLGSNVVYNDKALYQLSPLEVLKILRLFKDAADTEHSRNHALSQESFELSGGSRMNYRTYADGSFDPTPWSSNKLPMNITVRN